VEFLFLRAENIVSWIEIYGTGLLVLKIQLLLEEGRE
jgi:hypothetical protein